MPPQNNDDREARIELLILLQARFRRQAGELSHALRDGAITLATWLIGMRFLIKRLHAATAGLAAGVGVEIDVALTLAQIQEQYGFLNGFAAKIQAREGSEDELSGDAIAANAGLYAGAATATFWRVIRSQETEATEVRWHLRPAEHCVDCLELSGRGWMTVEELGGQDPGDGATICLTNCKCFLEFR